MVTSKFPLLIGYLSGPETIKAWCPFCKKWHIHGLPGGLRRLGVIGHWGAHCEKKSSPFWQSNGYKIKILSKAEIKAVTESLEFYPC